MIAWFEGHVSDGSIRGLTASLCIMDGVLLGMEAAESIMPSFCDDPIVTDQDTPHGRIRCHPSCPSTGQLDGPAHGSPIELRPHRRVLSECGYGLLDVINPSIQARSSAVGHDGEGACGRQFRSGPCFEVGSRSSRTSSNAHLPDGVAGGRPPDSRSSDHQSVRREEACDQHRIIGRTGIERTGVEVILHQTEAPGDAIGMIGALDLKPGDAIATIGGDGTMSEVITGMMTHLEDPRRVPIALVPAGTGNSQANDLAISTVADAVGRILAGRAHDLDIASVSLHEGLGGDGRRITRHCHNLVGWGLGVDSTIIAERLRFFGRMRYDIGIILTILRGRRRPARLILDGHVLDDDYTLLLVQNNRTGGSGLPLAPGASVDDGVMDIGILRRMTRRGVLRAFSLLKRDGRHVYLPDVTYHRFKTLRIETDHPTAINIDGENVGTTPLEMTVLPAALRIFA